MSDKTVKTKYVKQQKIHQRLTKLSDFLKKYKNVNILIEYSDKIIPDDLNVIFYRFTNDVLKPIFFLL